MSNQYKLNVKKASTCGRLGLAAVVAVRIYISRATPFNQFCSYVKSDLRASLSAVLEHWSSTSLARISDCTDAHSDLDVHCPHMTMLLIAE